MHARRQIKKPAGLTNFQKYLTFIGSILGIITACITIYTFTAKPATSSTSPSTTISSSSVTSPSQSSSDNPLTEVQDSTSFRLATDFCAYTNLRLIVIFTRTI
ncbi:DUF6556 family protein [Streptococcus suis]|uniref:DUF6556 family protein n=1 Tax=Streptococcus suis TaxID=1307 RepID=UPI003466A736